MSGRAKAGLGGILEAVQLGESGKSWSVEDLVQWVEENLTSKGVSFGPPTPMRATPWSAVVRWATYTPSGEQTVWGKSASPGFASECRLLPLLARRCPERVLAPIAIDADNGRLLMPDGGPTVKDFYARPDGTYPGGTPGTRAVRTFSDALVGYAAVQQEVADEVDALLDAGCVDLRPQAAVNRFDVLVSRTDLHRTGQPGGLAADEMTLLRSLVSKAERVATLLAAGQIPSTVQHDDLEPGNVLVDGRVLDWGDASVAHPFASLLTALMPTSAKRPGGQMARARVRDSYLDSWCAALNLAANDSSLRWLREQARLAVLLAPIGRIEAWVRAPSAALEMYPDAVIRWCRHMIASRWDT